MTIRTFFIATALTLLAVSCTCARDEDATDVATRAPDPRGGGHAEAPRARPAPAAAAPATGATDAARNAAIYGAVDVVQRYLARLGGTDRTAADAMWAYRRHPTADEEGGLRALLPARAMKIRNGTPRVLDSEPVPTFLEIPVTLRIDGRDGGRHDFSGWYRLRRNPVEQRWELVAASVSPAIR